MFSISAPVIAFTIFLICSQVSAIEPSNNETSSTAVHRHDEEQHVQGLLLKILTAGLQESRYAVFEYAIKEYHKNCFDEVKKIIIDSDQPNKLDQLKKVQTLYEKHVKDYAKQNRQAILDGQIPEPIARNAGVATNALCHQMFGFTL